MKYLLIVLLAMTINLAKADNYRVHAYTHNEYSDNYTVDLIVDGRITYYGGNIVYHVYYANQELTYSMDYMNPGYYSVQIDYMTFYFRF